MEGARCGVWSCGCLSVWDRFANKHSKTKTEFTGESIEIVQTDRESLLMALRTVLIIPIGDGSVLL